MEALLEQTARRAEAAFRSWPDRAVEAEGFLDDEGFEDTPPVRVHARVSASTTARWSSTSPAPRRRSPRA